MTTEKKKYTAEFKREAVRLITEQGYQTAEAALNLGILPLSIKPLEKPTDLGGEESLPG